MLCSDMAARRGLRLALTIFGVVEVIIPSLIFRKAHSLNRTIDVFSSSISLRIKFTRSRARFLLRRAKHGVLNYFSPPQSPLLNLPGEVRMNIWHCICQPEQRGRLSGVTNTLLVNKQIYSELKPVLDEVEHVISIGDLVKYRKDTVEFMGLPRIIRVDDVLQWHTASLKHLALQVNICGIGTMTPDCFDVYIAHNGKEQWRNLKGLIGIWPHTREVPLETVRLYLKASEYDSKWRTYRADFIRVIRNFKRTRVWAETGDCAVHKGNKSMLLPLVKAFNQGRRNWLEESTEDNNLIVRYNQQILSKSAMDAEEGEDEKFQAERLKWSVMPTSDTSRSENSVWPEWTGKEEKYIRDKMKLREKLPGSREWECRECFAVFDTPGERNEHVARGRSRR